MPGAKGLDANTGTTVTVMPKPVELIVDKARGTKTDPFAYVAPFETNRMGSHELYLWVSAPQVAGPLERAEGVLRRVRRDAARHATKAT